MRYLFRRKDSDNWYVRLQPPGQKVIERSLGTPDAKAEEIAAADIIKQHKQLMYPRRLARLPGSNPAMETEYAPGMHKDFFATEREQRDLKTGEVIECERWPATGSDADTGTARRPSTEARLSAKARPDARHQRERR